jgi:hypothetical protein
MLVADRGYDHGEYRRLPRQRGTRPAIAERGQPQSSGLNIFPRVVEGAISWLRGFRRLRIRGERRDDLHEALLGVTTCFITRRPTQRLHQDPYSDNCRITMLARPAALINRILTADDRLSGHDV